MLRVACMLGTENGIEICAPVHDAVLICAQSDRIDADVARMQGYMREASRIILDGFELETEISGPPSKDGLVRPIHHPSHYPEAERKLHPDRYMDEDRGRVMWDRVNAIVDRISQQKQGLTSDLQTAAPRWKASA